MTYLVCNNFIETLPKVELHAHLSGSFKISQLQIALQNWIINHPSSCHQLVTGYSKVLDDIVSAPLGYLSLEKCFQYFQILNFIVESCSIGLYDLFIEVLNDFESDNVMYLELRLTPKNIPCLGYTKLDYILCLIKAIETVETRERMKIRLVLSIDRKNLLNGSKLEATNVIQELIDLVISSTKLQHYVVGIEISGDPYKGNVTNLLDCIKSISVSQPHITFLSNVTVHTAEIINSDAETSEIFEFRPKRLGHCCYLSTEHVDQLCKSLQNTAIEICMTSNLHTLCIEPKKHHFVTLWNLIPTRLCVCTDDSGLFNTSLTNEFQLLVETFNLSRSDCIRLQHNAISYAFCSSSLKKELFKKLEAFGKSTSLNCS